MAVRPVLVYPDPRLKVECQPIEPGSDLCLRVAQDLRDTLDSAPGTGIAAPQIGELVSMVLIDPRRHPRYADSQVPRTVLCNPRLSDLEGSQIYREGCLSVPEYTGKTRRAKRVRLSASNEFGQPIELALSGFEAVLVQHELDHLDGVLFLDRLQSRSSLLRREEDKP